MSCERKNFNTEEFSDYVNFVQDLKSKNIDELIQIIISTLKEKAPFSVDINTSDNLEQYNKSISDLTEAINEKLKEKNTLEFDLLPYYRALLTRNIKEAFLPKKRTLVEKNIEAVLPQVGLYSLELVSSLKFRDLLNDIYGDEITILEYRRRLLEKDLLIRTIIDTDKKIIVSGTSEINGNLKTFKEAQYKILLSFVKLIEEERKSFDTDLLASTYYYGNKAVSKVNNIYAIMYNYILYLKSTGRYNDMFRSSWQDKIDGKPALFFDALNAYINLLFFDENLREAFGKYIQINLDYDEPINGEGADITYKYTFSSGNSEMVKGWETGEYQNAIDQMSGFSNIIIESIPLLSYLTGVPVSIGNYLQINSVYFINAIMNLRAAIDLLSSENKLHEILADSLQEPEKLIEIFETIFNPRGSGLTSEGKKLFNCRDYEGRPYLNEFDMNILYSIYTQVFNRHNTRSYYSIESKYLNRTGSRRNRYPIIGTMLGLINSTSAMNYLELVYDTTGDVPGYKIRVKRKFNSNSTIFDEIRAINSKALDRVNRNRLIREYAPISKNSESEMTVLIPIIRNLVKLNKSFTIHPDPYSIIKFKLNVIENSEIGRDQSVPLTLTFSTHILDKKAHCTLSKEIPGVVDKSGKILINISSINAQKEVFEKKDLKNYMTFLLILQFIDTMIGTNFSSDVDGLAQLNEFIRQGGSIINLLLASFRALRINSIYNDLQENGNYQPTLVLSFLRANTNSYELTWYEQDNVKDYISKDNKGSYLSTVSAGEQWLNKLIAARMILNGSVSKAVTSNANGDFIPNYSPSFLGSELQSYLRSAYSASNASSKLLFAHPSNRTAIKGVILDTDVKLPGNVTKQVKNMSESELIYHSIVDKFHLSLLNSPRSSVFILSTTFSDKTKYVGQEISLSDLGLSTSVYSNNIKALCEKKLYETVGEFYKKIWSNILDDYIKIYNSDNLENHITKEDPNCILKIESWLNSLSETQFTNKANSIGINVYRDLHYRLIGKGLSINELLYHYATNLYSSLGSVRKRMDLERVNFVNTLISTLTNFYVTRNSDGTINLLDAIGNFIKKYSDDRYESKWIKGNKLIIARIKRGGVSTPVEFGKVSLSPEDEIELNPFLESYFSVDVLLSNNLRLSLTGSEINHKVKGRYNIVKILTDNKVPNLFGFTKDTTVVSALELLNIIANTDPDTSRLELAKRAINLINSEVIYAREVAGLGALLKRNVIIPATMRHYLQNLIDGVPPTMRIAVIKDVLAVVLNFDGSGCLKKGKYSSLTIDAHDGFACINPIMSILENNSLLDNEVGDMKKNILHGYDNVHGCAVLLKYAAGAITNAWMRDSELSPISLRSLFKKMSNERWSRRNADGTITWLLTDNGRESGEVNLMESGYKHDDTYELNFSEDILQGLRLFYRDRGSYKAITDFGRDGNDYYTVEYEVSAEGKENSKEVKVYHYFDNFGRHITSYSPMSLENKFDGLNERYHTIDSIYELWMAMGGLNSMELVNGVLEDSEASLYATTSFVNFVANKRSTATSDEITLKNFDQPLKRAFIGYAVNNSAIKEGAGNMNSTDAYYKEEVPLKYITIDTKGHGVLLDADHHADEVEMTEFSQVITSLDAGGRRHNYVRLIYNALGRIALELSDIEIESVKEFRATGNKSRIYDLIGRTIMNNMKLGLLGLLKAIMDEIKKEFNVDFDHARNPFKIPFSDPNIYNEILSTFVSIINSKSIKRKYPGSGMVMMPGYDIETIFDFNGVPHQYQDLVKKAYKLLKNIKDSIVARDSMEYDRLLVKELLKLELSKYEITSKIDWLNPAERVNIYLNDIPVNLNNTLIDGDILIDTISDYYKIKGENQRKFLAEKLYGVKISNDYDKFWKPTDDNSHLNPDGTVKSNKAFDITLEGLNGSFLIVKDNESGFWSIHFKTGLKDPVTGEFLTDENGEILPDPNFTLEQKTKMFAAAALVIPEGEYLSTYGSITLKGVNGLNRFASLGFVQVDERTITDRLGNSINIPIYLSTNNIKFLKNITKGRNLAPVKIYWTMPDGTIMNIFDSWAIKLLYEKGIRDKKAIQETFDLIAKNKYWDGISYDEQGNKILVDITNVVSTEAECIVPNIFQSKFNIQASTSLVDVLESNTIFNFEPTLINSDKFDLAFTKNNNRHTYISFRLIEENSDTYESQLHKWNNIVVEENKDPEVVHRIFAVDKNNIKLFEVARDKINRNVVYNEEKGKYTDLEGNILDDLDKYKRYTNGLVLETITFLTRRTIRETINGKIKKYTLYNINRKALNEVYKLTDKNTIDNYIGVLLSDIYNSDDFNGLQLNSKILGSSGWTLQSALRTFSSRHAHNLPLVNLINGVNDLPGLLDLIKNFKDAAYVYDININTNRKLLFLYKLELLSIKKASFLKSLYFTASRIPAQSHQSFMLMKAAAFTRSNVTHTFVSHFLTWLQGSDYDIDKAYMMGMSFNGIGQYVGWSNLFDYSSIETIKASEYLPMPSKTEFIFDKQLGHNIDPYITRLNVINNNITQYTDRIDSISTTISENRKLLKLTKDKVEIANIKSNIKALAEEINNVSELINDQKVLRIRLYADLLTYLNDNNILEISWTVDPVEDVLSILLGHEFTKIPKSMLELATKNFISSHILNTVLNFTNMIGAYSPIEMEELREVSDNSTKGSESKTMSLMNPLVKYLMLYLNITGKNVISIAATGIKGAFTWHYYMNEILLNNINGINTELIKRSIFNFLTTRIHNRHKKDSEGNFEGDIIIKSIPDINWDNVSEDTKKLLFEDGSKDENVLIGHLTVDLLLSLVLSAATDNAKELILRKINAGSKLAKCYLFLITMGFDIKDIAAFMTSDIAEFIDIVTESNVYRGSSLNIDDAIKLLEGELPNKIIYNFFDKRTVNNLGALKEDIQTAFFENKLDEIKSSKYKGTSEYYLLIDYISYLKLLRSIMPEMDEHNKLDLNDFKKVLEGSNEFSNFARLLGINLGIKTKLSEFKGYLAFISNIIAERENKSGVKELKEQGNTLQLINSGIDPELVGTFNVERWLEDENYKEIIKDYYSKIKVAISIFDIIDEIALYSASYRLVDAVNTINLSISLKTKVLDCIYNNYENLFWSDKFRNNLSHAIYSKFIELYFYKSGVLLPYKSGAYILNKFFNKEMTKTDSVINFKDIQSMASFKLIFELEIIPKLKEGIYTTIENGKIVDKEDKKSFIKGNKFILGLISGIDRGVPLYRANIDMLNYSLTPEGVKKMESYFNGIKELSTIEVNGIPLSDWFILYNLYVNHNDYGSNRLTNIFSSFISSNKNSSILKDFFNFIGNLDYYGEATFNKEKNLIDVKSSDIEFTIDVDDLFMLAAPLVSSTIGKSDPMYRVAQETGVVFEKRKDNIYVRIDNDFFNEGTTLDIVDRLNNINNYCTLGGIQNERKLLLLNNLKSLDQNTIASLYELLLKNIIQIYKVCE